MITEHVVLNHAEGWRSITCTGTVVHIASVAYDRIRVRLGITSTGDGFIMEPGDTLKANETVYVKATVNPETKPAHIVVVKD